MVRKKYYKKNGMKIDIDWLCGYGISKKEAERFIECLLGLED